MTRRANACGRLLVVGLSARTMAEGAVAAGFRVDAADCFGDRDTLAVVDRWHPCGAGGQLALAPARLLALLAELARGGEFLGWVAGNGFEGRADLLAQGEALLPLLGNPAAVLRQVRTPATFFSRLSALAIAHPPIRLDPPPESGWLAKDAWGSGGWHVRRHDPRQPLPATGGGHYFQREQAGVPMSALFVADRQRARVLGFSRQLVRPLGGRPMVYRGCIGPVTVDAAVAGRIAGIADTLTRAFELRGVNGIDFLLDGMGVAILELNPRPVASIAVLHDSVAGGPIAAHLSALLDGRLPSRSKPPAGVVHGCETVFARRRLYLDGDQADRLAQLPWCHDRPASATGFSWGEPVCSITASGPDADAVGDELRRRRAQVTKLMEH
ncbi:MAG: ATP-grasp domain-containing protein [Rhodocyclaceae bacterium]|nr:ATP-grasp domain-containing protein [Rhodocyclaceae bacterium]